jgi:hypothetical protein
MRRKHRFAGSPKDHKREAVQTLLEVKRLVRDGSHHLKDGSCNLASQYVADALYVSGEYAANKRWVTNKRETAARTNAAKLFRQYVKACLVRK